MAAPRSLFPPRTSRLSGEQAPGSVPAYATLTTVRSDAAGTDFAPCRGRGDAISNRGGTELSVRGTASAKPVRVEVIAYAPTAFYHCQHCEIAFDQAGLGRRIRDEQLARALPDDLLRDYQALSDWAHALVESYCGRVVVKVVDAASVEGVWKSLRHRVRRYPAVVVEGRETCVGIDTAAVRRLIDRYLAPRAVLKAGA